MSTKTKGTESQIVDSSVSSIPELKLSYAHSIMQKRKAVLDHAVQAYEQAVKKRTLELGKLCLECGLGDYDSAFLKDQFLKLAGSFSKRRSLPE